MIRHEPRGIGERLKPVVLGKRHGGRAVHLRPVDQRFARQARRQLGHGIVHAQDHFQRVDAVAGRDHAADRLGPVLVQHPASRGRTEGHRGDLSDCDRHRVAFGDHHRTDVVQVFDEAQPADEVLHTVVLDRAGRHVEVGPPDRVVDLGQGDVCGVQRVGIEIDLIFTDEPADRGRFGHAVAARQGVPHREVLHRPQLV